MVSKKNPASKKSKLIVPLLISVWIMAPPNALAQVFIFGDNKYDAGSRNSSPYARHLRNSSINRTPTTYRDWSGSRYETMYSVIGRTRSNRDTKKATTWEAPTKTDQKIAQEIELAQVDYGPQDAKVVQLMWKHAKDYYDARDWYKANALIKKILALAEDDADIRAKLPMSNIRAAYADSATKMRPRSENLFRPFSYSSSMNQYGSSAASANQRKKSNSREFDYIRIPNQPSAGHTGIETLNSRFRIYK